MTTRRIEANALKLKLKLWWIERFLDNEACWDPGRQARVPNPWSCPCENLKDLVVFSLQPCITRLFTWRERAIRWLDLVTTQIFEEWKRRVLLLTYCCRYYSSSSIHLLLVPHAAPHHERGMVFRLDHFPAIGTSQHIASLYVSQHEQKIWLYHSMSKLQTIMKIWGQIGISCTSTHLGQNSQSMILDKSSHSGLIEEDFTTFAWVRN